ncbi:MAG: hypothetical protein CL489_03210 [Acidobacteria bacterium]|nr:hypothetical protein [Acidobacteriota bacterium]|tara:strand:- start:435 stop:794 length:360 start_codon:yes stop_codon:yes gene_type:complete
MRYTIDGPDMALEAFVVGDGYEQSPIATLVHLPDASAKTAAMFGRHTAETWDKQPKYAAFRAEPGSSVIRWSGKTINIDSPEDLAKVFVGRLRQTHIPGEFGSYGKTWVVDTNAKVYDG